MISIAWKQLGWTRDQYEFWLAETHDAEIVDHRPRLTSLNKGQLVAAYRDLESRGFKPTHKGGVGDAAAKRAMIGKLSALWMLLADNGEVREGSVLAMQNWVVRDRKLKSWRWASTADLSASIEALKSWCQRVGGEVDPSGMMTFPDRD